MIEAVKDYFSFQRKETDIAVLDGIRGLSILLVLARHTARAMHFDVEYQPTFPIGDWDAIIFFLNGWAGVDLFFILSGFLITHILLKRRRQKKLSFKRYILKRFLRIAPSYYFVLLVVAFGLLPFYRQPAQDWGFRLAYHLAFLQDYLPANFVVAFWSLGVEEKFYLLMPLLMVALFRVKHPGQGVGLILGVMCLSPLSRLYGFYAWQAQLNHTTYFYWLRSPFHMSLDSLMAGVLVAYLYNHRQEFGWPDNPVVQRRIYWTGLVGSLLLLGSTILVKDLTALAVTFTPNLLALFFGMFVMGAVLQEDPPFGRFLKSKFLLVFCRLSYTLYLVHMCFMHWVRDWLWTATTGQPAQAFIFSTSFFLMYLVVYWTVSIAASLLVHFLVEKPGLMLKDKL